MSANTTVFLRANVQAQGMLTPFVNSKRKLSRLQNYLKEQLADNNDASIRGEIEVKSSSQLHVVKKMAFPFPQVSASSRKKNYIIASISYNQTRNCTAVMMERNPTLATFQLVLLTIIFVCGTILNSFAVWVFCCKMKKWTETTIFMMTLQISDCCLLFTIPFRIYASQNSWDLGKQLCNAVTAAYFMNTYMSIATITLISVDRYIAIKFPLRSRTLRSTRNATVACAIVWVLLLATRIYLILSTDSIIQSQGFCFRKTSTRPLKRSIYFTILGFYTPLPIMVFCSVETIRILKRKDTFSMHEQKSIQKTTSIMSANLAIFLFCFLPIHILNVVRFVAETMEIDCTVIKSINDYVYGGQVIGDLNCCLDSICYYFVATEFRESSSLFPKSDQLKVSQEPTQDSKTAVQKVSFTIL
ncbi:G-protein coupled receptor 35-like [Rhinophrynus dorsalis]